MTIEWWLALVKEGGMYCAVLEFGALMWMNADRNRLLVELKAKSIEVKDLAVQVITIATELKVFLFNERKTS